MTYAAIISFCSDLTDPNGKSIPLFKVTLEDAKLNVSYLQSPEEMNKSVGRDNFTLGIVQMYPWYLASYLQEVGCQDFFINLVEETRNSSIFVERLEPC